MADILRSLTGNLGLRSNSTAAMAGQRTALMTFAAYVITIGTAMTFAHPLWSRMLDMMAKASHGLGMHSALFKSDAATDARLAPVTIALGLHYLLCTLQATIGGQPTQSAAVLSGVVGPVVHAILLSTQVMMGRLPYFFHLFSVLSLLGSAFIGMYGLGSFKMMGSGAGARGRAATPATARGFIMTLFGLYVFAAGMSIAFAPDTWHMLMNTVSKTAGLKYIRDDLQTSYAQGCTIAAFGFGWILAGLQDDDVWARASMFSTLACAGIWGLEMATGRIQSIHMIFSIVNVAYALAMAATTPDSLTRLPFKLHLA